VIKNDKSAIYCIPAEEYSGQNAYTAIEHSAFLSRNGGRLSTKRSLIILAGGISSRLGQDKGLVLLAGKPMIRHVLDKTKHLVDEGLIIVSSKGQAERYSRTLGSTVNVLVDDIDVRSPLVGAASGFAHACGEYSLLLSCDTPFVSKEILQLLLELCIDKNAAIPRWPNGYTEPLQAAYSTKPALAAVEEALRSGNRNVQAMIDRLQRVRYVSTLVLRQLDPDLKTFLNVNTYMDLKKVEAVLAVK